MAWLRGDDGAGKNRRVLRAGFGRFLKRKPKDGGPTGSPQQERCTVYGFVSLCASWSAYDYSDLFVPYFVAYEVAGPDTDWLVEAAITAGLFAAEKTTDAQGDEGWQIPEVDNLFHVRTREEVQQDRDRRNANSPLVGKMAVYARDGDTCRYCLRSVTPWVGQGGDQTTTRSRTLDHVDPADPDTDRVVACRGCNSAKGDKSAEEWAEAGGYTLQPPPEQPRFHPRTVAKFAEKNQLAMLPEYARRDLVPAVEGSKANQEANQEQTSEQAKAHAEQGNDQATAGVREQAPPGRVGSPALVWPAQVGSDQVGPGPGPADVRPLRPVRDDDSGGAA